MFQINRNFVAGDLTPAMLSPNQDAKTAPNIVSTTPSMPSGPTRESLLAAIASLDLTSLAPATDTDESTRILCQQAQSGPVPCAAVCVLPKFVALAKTELAGSGVKVATVVNFPEGVAATEEVERQSRGAIADGVDEIDVVWNWRKFTLGDENGALAPIRAVAEAVAGSNQSEQIVVKVILETAALESDSVYDAAHLVLHRLCGYGADSLPAGAEEDPDYVSPFSSAARTHLKFLKTSTGQLAMSKSDPTPVSYENKSTGATPAAVRALAEAINDVGARSVGIKVSGGVRTVEDAVGYLDIVSTKLDGELEGRFRIGASNVYGKLVSAVESHGV
ncbi:aldolase [Gonapodya prolifera JEL478]|uniref:deoxyribose-phosphate aldolase n=1 Tax=Gonapodya prolifera (strain JEL478) TaxID=1344416 RepID=A0A139AAB5_GONPJ|nr:aldolase [Gonapodya prolifera JEL478]|eukprot:KXS13736.1 aldolase [Gonapodya prolifera JEL478]